ncbi:MAG: hypothetical protein RLZZ299_2492 [Pseudomonadota bacterium]
MTLGALALLTGLAHAAGPSPAARPAVPAGKAAAAPAPAPSAPTPTARTAAALEKLRQTAFAEADARAAASDVPGLEAALVAVLDDAARAPVHAEAAMRLGQAWAGRNLPYAALLALARGLRAAGDLDRERIGASVPAALGLADRVGDTMLLEAAFTADVTLAPDGPDRGRAALLAARGARRDGNLAVALGLVKMIGPEDPRARSARLLEATVLARQGRWEPALRAIEAARKAPADSPDSDALLVLDAARTWYGAGNYPRALQGWASVPRESPLWPQAQAERAWGHFRLDDHNGTLGALVTLQQPFFDGRYQPEADLLRVYSAFLLCKFPTANTELEAFKARYAPVNAAMQAALAVEPAALFAQVGDPGGATATGLPRGVRDVLAEDPATRDAVRSVAAAEAELAALTATDPGTARARAWLTERRDARVRDAGMRVRTALATMQADLGGRLGDAEIFGLDILRMQTRLYEMAAANGGEAPDAVRTVQRDEAVRPGWRAWPYEGEAWADELGYYRVTAVPDCPAGLRRD